MLVICNLFKVIKNILSISREGPKKKTSVWLALEQSLSLMLVFELVLLVFELVLLVFELVLLVLELALLVV